MDEETDPTTTADPDAGSTEHSAPDAAPGESPRAQDETGASGGSETTAPDGSLEREAYRRLQAGEAPQDIAQSPGPKKAEPTTPAPKGQKQSTADATDQPGEAAQGQAETDVSAASLGLTDAEVNALRRGKMDLGLLKSVPPANRKALARQLQQSQAELDRQFQVARTGKSAEGTSRGDKDGGEKPDTDGAKGASGGGGGDGDGTDDAGDETTTTTEDRPAGDNPLAALFEGNGIAERDLETLREIGGDEFADAMSSVSKTQQQAVQQAVTPLVGLLGQVFDRFETMDFEAGVNDLRSTPGFESIGDDGMKALREKAERLVKAQGDPNSYGLRQAVADAAPTLFKINPNQAAQAALLRGRDKSLSGQPERAGQKANRSAAPPTEDQRLRMTFRMLQDGKSQEEINRFFAEQTG